MYVWAGHAVYQATPTKHEGGGVKIVMEERVARAPFVAVVAINRCRTSDKKEWQ